MLFQCKLKSTVFPLSKKKKNYSLEASMRLQKLQLQQIKWMSSKMLIFYSANFALCSSPGSVSMLGYG